ncbi:MAG: hypothetical protein OHK0022_39790 [Roseiflexaceae bacterium]
MPTFLTKLGRVPLLIAAGVVAVVLFALLLLGGGSTAPAQIAQTSPSVVPASPAPTQAALSTAPTAAAAPTLARSAPTNTLPPSNTTQAESPVPSTVPAGGTTNTTPVVPIADAPQSEPVGNSTPAQPSAGSRTATTPAQPAPAEQSDQVQRYVSVAQQVSPSKQGQRPGSEWRGEVIKYEPGYGAVIIMPLDAAPTNAEFVRVAKQRIALVVNALFLNDPQIIRVGVVGTFPNERGEELPAVSLVVSKNASPTWGQVSAEELDRIAQSVNVRERYRP